MLARALYGRFWDPRPFVLSHLITARCNADCATCLWKQPANSRADELTADEIERLYGDAAAAGCVALVVWGGEPMVRPDVGRILRAAKARDLETTLITNGWWLEERAAEVLPHANRLLVSVDALGAAHDKLRRCPGLFERLDRGLGRARRDYPRLKVTLIAVLSRPNSEEIPRVAAYARDLGVHVVFQAMNFSDYGFSERALDVAALRLSAEEEQEVAATIARLKAAGLPVRDSQSYLRRLGTAAWRYRCHYKKVVLRVEPQGDILDCTKDKAPLANVRATRLGDFLAGDGFRQFMARAEACNRCRDVGVLEVSHVWDGKLPALWNALSGLR